MPDLMTHTLVGLIFGKIKPSFFITDLLKKRMFVIFLSGNMLPDLFSRVPQILFPSYTPFFGPPHTLLGAAVVSYAVSLLFKRERRKIFLYLLAGTVFHFLLDLTQKDLFGGGYMLFFPLEVRVSFGFMWPEDSVYIMPFLLVITIVLYRLQIHRYFKGIKK
ncbi:metal-dependent hydrolase [Elusimicrobiota bacterium]